MQITSFRLFTTVNNTYIANSLANQQNYGSVEMQANPVPRAC